MLCLKTLADNSEVLPGNNNNNNNNANIFIAELKQNSSGALMAQTNTVPQNTNVPLCCLCLYLFILSELLHIMN